MRDGEERFFCADGFDVDVNVRISDGEGDDDGLDALWFDGVVLLQVSELRSPKTHPD